MDKSRFFHSKRPRLIPSIAVFASCFLVTSGADDPVGKASELVGHRIIEPFDYRGVTLDAGPLKNLQTGRSRTSTTGVGSTTQPRNGTRSARTSTGPTSQLARRSTGSSPRSGSTGTTGTSTLGPATSSLPDRMVIAIPRTTPTAMSTPWVERGPPIR